MSAIREKLSVNVSAPVCDSLDGVSSEFLDQVFSKARFVNSEFESGGVRKDLGGRLIRRADYDNADSPYGWSIAEVRSQASGADSSIFVPVHHQEYAQLPDAPSDEHEASGSDVPAECSQNSALRSELAGAGSCAGAPDVSNGGRSHAEGRSAPRGWFDHAWCP
jgi:hypothetical protein